MKKILVSIDDVLSAFGEAYCTEVNAAKLVDFDLGLALVDILFHRPDKNVRRSGVFTDVKREI